MRKLLNTISCVRVYVHHSQLTPFKIILKVSTQPCQQWGSCWIPSAVCEFMCTPCRSAVKMSSMFGNHFPCSGIFNFGMSSKSPGLRSGESGGCYNIPHPHSCKRYWIHMQCGLLQYHGELLRCLEVLDVSSAMYDAGMICSMRHWQDDTLEYFGAKCQNDHDLLGWWILSKLASSWWTWCHSLVPVHTLMSRFHPLQ